MVKLKILFFLFTFLFIENLFAINGENLYNKYGCYGCHGPEGLGGTSFPSIANKDKDYLIKKLILYKKGNVKTIQAGLMIPFAKNLSLDEIKSLSLFLENITISKEYEELEWDIDGSGGS